jgi:outer membrane biosynthesis protein TonB
MRTGLTISGIAHVSVLLVSALAFVAKPYQAASTDALPVDIVSAQDFSQMTAGAKTGQPQTRAPLADATGELKPVEDPNAAVAKREVKAATDVPSPPKPPEQPAKKQAAQPPKADQIAEAIKKDAATKPQPKKVEAKTQPKKQADAPAFDPRQVQALLDKRSAQRLAATGEAVNSAVALGTPDGKSATLSQSELDALRARLKECWSPPLGIDKSSNLQVILNVRFNADGSVVGNPEVVSGPASSMGPVMAESAKRALLSCQPFTMLKREHYELWKNIEINFDASEMLRG